MNHVPKWFTLYQPIKLIELAVRLPIGGRKVLTHLNKKNYDNLYHVNYELSERKITDIPLSCKKSKT